MKPLRLYAKIVIRTLIDNFVSSNQSVKTYGVYNENTLILCQGHYSNPNRNRYFIFLPPEGMLTMRARPPPAKDFIDVFQKFKLSFNLLVSIII